MTEQQEQYETEAIIARKVDPYALDSTLAPVDWKAMREQFDPQGPSIPAEELVGRSFTILSLKPFKSAYAGKRSEVYWIKAMDQDGTLFNTVLGGVVVCETLDAFAMLNAEYIKALQERDEVRIAELEAVGAGRPIGVTLIKREAGSGVEYYDFE